MFYGDSCEFRNGSSGAFSLLLFILVIALVIAGIGLLYPVTDYSVSKSRTSSSKCSRKEFNENTLNVII